MLLENISPLAENKFLESGFEVASISKSLAQEELLKKIKDVSILGIRSKTTISKEILDYADSLVGIGAFCIGTDQIDVYECSKKGVGVFNAPFSNTRSVVELAMGEIIMLLRGVFDKNKDMHNCIWNKSSENSLEVRGKNLGIVGYGKIGSQLSVLAEMLGMNVYYFDLQKKLSLGNAKKCSSLEKLLNVSDIVTLHVDGNKGNRGFFGRKEFEAMKDKSYFLNLSRGFVIDTEVLGKYLDKGKILGAAIDVFENEPSNNKEPFKSILQNKRNVILTPHIGGNTLEAQENIASFVSDSLNSFYFHGDTSLSVNFPNLSLDSKNYEIRFSHLHKNIPGVLANINKIISKHNINIAGQYLKTRDNLGYVVTDIEGKFSKEMADELRKVDGTISLRIVGHKSTKHSGF